MTSPIDQIRATYSLREPPGTDTWNPLSNDLELWHRARLLITLCSSLRRLKIEPNQIKALDVGCGVGRSSRLLVDFGIPPTNILGIDLRLDAINHAKTFNPAIRFQTIQSLSDWPAESFNLIIQCTAFSSIPSLRLRQETAKRMSDSLSEGGMIFWWDTLKTATFAGSEPLDPTTFFSDLFPISVEKVSVYPTFEDLTATPSIPSKIAGRLFKAISTKPSHFAASFSNT